MPVSRTAKCERDACPRRRGSASTRTIDLALLGELDRVREQVEQHLPQPRRVADDRRPARSSSTRQPSSTPFSDGARRDDVERALDALAQVERLALELEPAGLDLREVEDVVDDVEQRVAARADDLGELALLRRQLGAEQQAGHADHGVHRRPDLVAHRREEGALRPGRRLRLLRAPAGARRGSAPCRSRSRRTRRRPLAVSACSAV